MKGAPREVLQLCTHVLIQGEARPLDDALRADILAANDDYARGALRVLALACRDIPPLEDLFRQRGGSMYTVERIERQLTFLGLAAMMDPPRPEVAAAVTTCREAGIRLAMITGDYGLTAESVARRVGLLSTTSPRILIGAELDELDDAQLQDVIKDEVIFARMAPEHKLRLVDAFQTRGGVVAVIGDGVNDAPALRKADIGVAMGVTGTDVAREAADVILTDDNFGAITEAIAEGRTVYANLRKFATYIFASNVPELIPFVLTGLFNIPLALTAPQILAIDLGTDLFPALALSTEKPEPDVMKHPPRNPDQPILDRGVFVRAFAWLGVIETILCFAGFYFVFNAWGYSVFDLGPIWGSYAERLASDLGPAYILATTVFHAGVVLAQAGNAFACRTEKGRVRGLGLFSNRFLLAGIALEIGLIVLLIYVSPLNRLFDHAPLPPNYWLWLAAFGPIVYSAEWMRKRIVRRLERKRMKAEG